MTRPDVLTGQSAISKSAYSSLVTLLMMYPPDF